MMMITSVRFRKLRYRSTMMTAGVKGTTSFRRSFARTMYSYCPDQDRE